MLKRPMTTNGTLCRRIIKIDLKGLLPVLDEENQELRFEIPTTPLDDTVVTPAHVKHLEDQHGRNTAAKMVENLENYNDQQEIAEILRGRLL